MHVQIYVCVVAMDMHVHNACSIHDRAIIHTDVLYILLLGTYSCSCMYSTKEDKSILCI